MLFLSMSSWLIASEERTGRWLPLLLVGSPASGKTDFRGVTGGVYKARERIHPSMLTSNY